MSTKSLRAEASRIADEASAMEYGEDRAKRFAYALGLIDAASFLETGEMPARGEQSELHLSLVRMPEVTQ